MATLTLDYAADQVSPPLDPTPDDQSTVNQITTKRVDGGEHEQSVDEGPLSTQAPPDGVGIYDRQLNINVATDSQLGSVAGWALHIGTWDEDRYPVIRTNIRQLSTVSAALVTDALALDVASNGRIQIESPPDWMPAETIDQYVLGYSESISIDEWTQDWHTTPAGPYRTWVLEDSIFGRLDTGGSSLAADIDDSATSVSLHTDSGSALWLTDADLPTQFPLNLVIGAEVVRVTALSGSSSPQTATVLRGINGFTRAWSAGTKVQLSPSAVGL